VRIAKILRDPSFVGKAIVWWVKRAESKDIPHILKELRDTATAKIKFPNQVAAKYHEAMAD
jgi:hypothetical protein